MFILFLGIFSQGKGVNYGGILSDPVVTVDSNTKAIIGVNVNLSNYKL